MEGLFLVLRSKPATVHFLSLNPSEGRVPIKRFFSILPLVHAVNPDPKSRMNHPPTLPYSALRKVLTRPSAEMGTRISRGRTPSKIQSYSKRVPIGSLSGYWRKPNGGGPGGGLNLGMITRPSNEMLDHWLYSAACSRSSPTAQPGSHHDNRQ